MPIVPRVQPTALPGVRVGGPAPEAAFGGGAGNVTTGINGGLSAVHDEAARIVKEERAKADEVMLTGAGGELTAVGTDSLYGPNGALTKTGSAAFDTPETARKEFFDKVGQIRTRLTSDEQRNVFDHMTASQWGEIDRQVQHHVAAQRQAYDDSQTDSAITALNDQAIKGYSDPDVVKRSIEGIRGNATLYGLRNGWSKEQIDVSVAKRISDTHVGVLSRMLDTQDDVGASKYYADHRDEIDGPHQAKVEKALEAASALGKAQRVVDLILAGKYASGLVSPGNVDLTNRPRVANPDGSISTVRSMSFERDGHEILIPTVSNDGKLLTNDEAIAQYDRTGKHLGIFADGASATRYAQQLHVDQARALAGAPSVSPTDALAHAEAIQDPKVRQEATQMVMAHFNNLDRVQRLDREGARARLVSDLEASNGRLNKGSLDWQLIDGQPEGEQVLARQHQILHPPPDPGDPDKYNTYVAMAATSPATRQALLTTNIADIVKDATLSGGQKTAIINLIRSERNRDVADVRRQASEAQQEAKHFEQLVKKAQQDGDDDAVENNTPLMYAAQQRATVLRGQLLAANREAGVGHTAAQGDAPALAQPVAPERAHPFDPAAFGLGTASLKPLTPDMLRDIATYGPGYADHLRAFGYAVPKVLPKPQPAAAKK
jgi:hypothetical protein